MHNLYFGDSNWDSSYSMCTSLMSGISAKLAPSFVYKMKLMPSKAPTTTWSSCETVSFKFPHLFLQYSELDTSILSATTRSVFFLLRWNSSGRVHLQNLDLDVYPVIISHSMNQWNWYHIIWFSRWTTCIWNLKTLHWWQLSFCLVRDFILKSPVKVGFYTTQPVRLLWTRRRCRYWHSCLEGGKASGF